MGVYELLEVVRRGPDGELYRARNTRTGRDASLRLLPASEPLEETVAAARRMAVVFHPHLGVVLDAGSHQARAYVVRGDERWPRLADASVSMREAVALLRDAASGVAYAAERGLVHPALDPDAVRISPSGRAVVTGYERVRPGGAEAYRSPEVRAGRAVGVSSNVYSLGALLYALVAGRPPSGAPEPPSRFNPLVPGEIEDLILRAIDADPARRPDPGRLVAELSRWLEGQEPTAAPPARPASPGWKRAWDRVRRPRTAFAAGAALLILAAFGFLRALGGHRDEQAAKDAPTPPASAAVRVAEPLPPPTSEPPAQAPAPEPAESPPPVPAEPPVPAAVPPPPPPPPPAVETPAPPPPPPPPPRALQTVAADRLGTIKFIHPEYGVFVALDAGAKVAVGDRLGAGTSTLIVRRITRPEKVYPNGAAVCEPSGAPAKEGDVVRKAGS